MRGPRQLTVPPPSFIGASHQALARAHIRKVIASYDPDGSLSPLPQGSGHRPWPLQLGILGWEPDDERLPTFPQALEGWNQETIIASRLLTRPPPEFPIASNHRRVAPHLLDAAEAAE
jgi:hypothetical protein